MRMGYIGGAKMNQQDSFVLYSRPVLRSPYLVCGFNGWINGGDVSAGGMNYLIKQLKAKKFAEIPISAYHIYQISGAESLRPVFKMQDGLIVETHLPQNEFYYALNPASDHDLVLFLGTEPNLNWEKYTETVVSLACDFNVCRLIAFGGIFDNTPYTREPKISCTCTDARVKAEMENYNVTYSNREGPATFNQMLLYACKQKGLDGVAFTARAPYYTEFNVAIGYSPKSIKAILVRLNHIMRLGLDFNELNISIKDLEGKLDFVRQQNQQFSAYIDELEKDYVETPFQEPLDISPNEAVRFAEEFLKGNNNHQKQ